MLEEHKKVTGSDKLNRDGYPDMGNGFYSKFLSYADWVCTLHCGNFFRGGRKCAIDNSQFLI